MVLIFMKLTEKNQFLYEAPSTMKIEEVIKDLVIGKPIKLQYFFIS